MTIIIWKNIFYINILFYIYVISFALIFLICCSATAGTPQSNICVVSDSASLRACAVSADHYDTLSFAADVTSPYDPASCQNGGAFVFRNLEGKLLDGHGHTWRRRAPLSCAAILIAKSRGIEIRNLSIVENADIPPCELAQKQCPSTIDVDSSARITLAGVRLYDGKGYVIKVWHTDQFTFTNGVISNAGEIGLYVGHWRYGESHKIAVTNSVIAHSRTGGVAIQGADGVTISGNIFNENHWHGLWPVPGVKGGITSGGQLLLADATNARVTGNLFANGACGNCVPTGQTVSTIELGEGPAEPGVRSISIENNMALNVAGTAFYQNVGGRVEDVRILGNRLRGRVVLDTIKANATRSDNSIDVGSAPRLGHSSSAAYRIAGNHDRIAASAIPGRTVETVFGLSPAPLPDGPTAPVMHCTTGTADFAFTGIRCGGAGMPAALLGFAFPSGYPGTQPFFSCQTIGQPGDRFLSWDPHCEGQTVIAAMGNAIVRQP
jgi:hypothetical protein